MTSLTITSSAFKDGQPMPRKYTQDGENLSPPLAWQGLPPGTRQLALICDDPDAPRPEPWVHWVIYGIHPALSCLSEGIGKGDHAEINGSALQGRNTGESLGYDGPKPPHGHGVHHYYFKLYALDEAMDLRPGLNKEDLLKAIDGHVLAKAELIGTYER
jgi:Raf kinase inhibitor-like YbhB/YbcL family protein